ncbi:MAG: hypothetical protein ACTSVU_06575 [Promethearchaeota archaeon]
MDNVSEKLHELQENLQYLQILKQMGAQNLVLKQEKEIVRIQQEIMNVDKATSIDATQLVLPKKCRFCPEKTTDQERFECFEKNGKKCKVKVNTHINLVNVSIMRVVVTFFSIIALILVFLLLTNISMQYFPAYPIISFAISAVGVILVFFALKGPMVRILHSL